MEKRLGFIDIKSSASGVYFNVQRNNSNATSTGPTVVRYDVQRLNLGGGMNPSTGVFTVPKSGVYHFDFIGLKQADLDKLVIILRVNRVRVAYSASGYGPVVVPLAIHSTLQLKSGDRVDIFIETGTLMTLGYFCTHFTGWLLEENIVAPF